MTTQPEALRLANRLESDLIRSQTMVDAAAKLRRLAKVEAQRDALLEACKALLPVLDKAWDFDGDVFGRLHNDAVDADARARAVIKSVEVNT